MAQYSDRWNRNVYIYIYIYSVVVCFGLQIVGSLKLLLELSVSLFFWFAKYGSH